MEIAPDHLTIQDLVGGTMPSVEELVPGAPRLRIDSVRTTGQVADARPYELLVLGSEAGALTLADVDHLAAQRAIGVILPSGAQPPATEVADRCRSLGLAVLRLRPAGAGELRTVVDRGERNLRMLADGAGPWGILAALALDVGAPAMLLAESGRILATAGRPSPQETVDAARRWLRAGRPHPRPGDLDGWYVFPVPALERVDAHLLLGREAADDDAARLAVIQALVVLAADGALRGQQARAVEAGEPIVPLTETDHATDGAPPSAPSLALVAPEPEEPIANDPIGVGDHDELLRLQRPEVLRSLASALLTPVEGYDAERGTELVATLAAFLEHDGRWEQTAATLDVHVNTLRNRLARVEQLTGRDLAELCSRVDFALALRARALAGSG